MRCVNLQGTQKLVLEHNLESALCTLLKLILIFSYSFMFIKFHTITSKNKSKICF